MREKLIECYLKSIDKCLETKCRNCEYFHEPQKPKRRCQAAMVVDDLIANGVTIATENNVRHETMRFLVKRKPLSKDELIKALDGPVLLNTGEEYIVSIPSQWISVRDRLPEVVDSYLVVIKAKYDYETEYEIAVDVATYNPYEKAYIDDCWNTYNDWDEGQQYLHVTHWMPLPEPPKEDNDE